jgi:2-keto-3-deoxy-L-rhamnonate aldolase RhmA
MKANLAKRRLGQGHVVVGTMAREFMTPALMPIVAAAGGEFVLLDMEHTPWSLETLRGVVAAGVGTEVAPLIRVPDAAYHLVARALDIGALGIVIPNCVGETEAREAVGWARYPPLGSRSFGIPRYERDPRGAGPSMESANAEIIVSVLIETIGGLEEVERIASVPGVDLIWIGQVDLATSLGVVDEPTNALFQEAVERILAACARAGKPVGILANTVDEATAWVSRGARCIAFGLDSRTYEDALSAGIRSIHQSLV